jgi:transposase-like protein
MNNSAPQTDGQAAAMPTCPRCHRPMIVSRIVPDQPGHETRTYRCAACGDEISEKALTR